MKYPAIQLIAPEPRNLYEADDTELMEWIADHALGQYMDLGLRSYRGMISAKDLQAEIDILFADARDAMDFAAREQREMDRGGL